MKKVASALKDDYLSVISAGDPLGSNAPRAFEGGVVYDWCPSKDALIDRCDVFVSRAGHVTISDLILRGKPSILVPIQAQMEQMGNAAKAEKLGVAVDLPEERLVEGYFRDALSRLESGRTSAKARELKEYVEQVRRGRFDNLRSLGLAQQTVEHAADVRFPPPEGPQDVRPLPSGEGERRGAGRLVSPSTRANRV